MTTTLERPPVLFEHPTEQRQRTRSPLAILWVILPATFMQLLDVTIVNVALPAIRTDLHATSGQVQLVVAGYQLAFACSLLVGGRLGDVFGRRRLFLIGMVGFVVASAACGLAPTGAALVGARLVQGACSGLMFPQVLSIIQTAVPGPRKPQAFGIYGATVGLATVLGPLLGGALVSGGLGWRSVFLVNLPIGVAAFVGGLRRLDESTGHPGTRLDGLGAVLATAGLFLLILPLVIGRDEGWPVWTYGALAAGAVTLLTFAAHQRRAARRPGRSPLVQPALFHERGFTIGVLMNLVFFAGLAPLFFVFIFSLQVGLGASAIQAGLATLPFAAVGAIASSRSAGVAQRLGPRILALGATLLAIGIAGVMGVLRIEGGDAVLWHFAPALVVAGVGMGFFAAPVTNLVLAGIEPRNAGAASGVIATAQQVGGAAGVAIVGVLFFGLLGGQAPAAAESASAPLRARIVAAGAPAPVAGEVTDAFATCFTDRVTAEDPTVAPPSCGHVGQVIGTIGDPRARAGTGQAIEQAQPRVRAVAFTGSLERSLYWTLGVFILTALLALALPRPTRRPGAPGGAPEMMHGGAL
jgi:EmrB/QacA subfamily drug resistance transporter